MTWKRRARVRRDCFATLAMTWGKWLAMTWNGVDGALAELAHLPSAEEMDVEMGYHLASVRAAVNHQAVS